MKNKLTMLIAMAISPFLNAQITLNSTSHSPQAGEDFEFVHFAITPFDLQEGENLIWDFSEYTSEQTISLDITEGVGNVMSYRWSNGAEYTYELDEQLMSQKSFHSPMESGYCTSGEEYLFFPITYGDSKEYSYKCHYVGKDPEHDTIEGEITISAVGYGDLILPFGTVENVLLVRRDKSHIYDGILAGSNSTTYFWYHENNFLPIATYEQFGETLAGLQYQQFNTWAALDVPEEELISENILFPNPAQSTLHIASETKAKSISFYNIQGILVKTEDLSTTKQIDVSGLSRGMYMIQLLTEDGLQRKKLILN